MVMKNTSRLSTCKLAALHLRFDKAEQGFHSHVEFARIRPIFGIELTHAG